MTLPRGDHLPNVSDQAKGELIRGATKCYSQHDATSTMHDCGEGVMSHGDEQQLEDIIYTNDETYSMCSVLPRTRGHLTTVSQYSSSPTLSFRAV